jgi:hypothetical protein
MVAVTTSVNKIVYVNTNKALTLSGKVTAQSSCVARWTADSAAVNLAASALTPLTTNVAAGSQRTLSLLIAANSLPARTAMTFSLNCGPASVNIDITTNGPPLPGKFAISPLTGDALSTPFQLAAAFWSDPNLPISYQFSLVSSNGAAALVLQSRSEQSSASSVLPAGLPSASFGVSVQLQVFDALNAGTSVTSSVTVKPGSDNTIAAQDAFVRDQLASSAGNVDATKSALSLSGAVLNAVSCSNAPDCSALHRADCSEVQDTCGVCLAGYIGDHGDRNTLCADSATLSATGTSPTSGSACTSNSDCTGWETCAGPTPSTMVCGVAQKVCASGCEEHGSCTLVNANSRQVVEDCKTGDASCTAVCSCDSGYSGLSCDVTAAELSQKQAVREDLISSLSAVTKTDDVNQDTVAMWSSSLAALSQDSFSLSGSAIASINDVASSILTGAASVDGLSYDVASSVLDALNSAADANLRMNASNADTIAFAKDTLATISQFNDLVASQLVTGQEGVSYLYDSFRLTALRQLVEGGQRVSAQAPRTNLEVSSDAAVSSVSVDSDGDTGEFEEFAVNLVTTTASSYGPAGSAFHTNPVHVSVSRTSGLPSTMRFSLVHNSAVAFANSSGADDMLLNTTCLGGADRSVVSYTCPVSGETLVHNCSGLHGVLTSYCALIVPRCAILDTATGALDTNSTVCRVTDFDAYSTECTCVLPAPGGRRLEDAIAQSGLLDVVSSSVYLGNEFVDTFNSADDLNSLADLKRVLIVIIMFSTLWAGGLLLICGCAWRRKLMEGHNKKEESLLARKMQSAQVSRSPAAVRQYLADYVVATFPSVFSNKPFFTRLYGEIRRHHRYLRLFTAPEGDSGDKERILTGAQLLTVQTMLMFLLALLYDVQGPSDDGTCVVNTDEVSCVTRKSPFDSSQSYCRWSPVDGQSSSDYECVYQEPVFSLQVVIYIAVMVALMVAVITYPVDRIFDLLSAPLADEFKVATQDTAVKRIGRRLSNAARRASNVAMSVANAAKAKLGATRNNIVGTITRKIPGDTEAAHALASASITVIAESSRQHQHDRQLARMRVYYESGGGVFRRPRDDDEADSDKSGSDSDSNSDSDSDDSNSSSDNSSRVKNAKVRRTERVGALTNVGASNAQTNYKKGPTAATSAADDVDAKLRALAEEVQCQRRLLKSSELELFDEQWGMDPTGEFALGEHSRIPFLPNKPGARELIRKELEFVRAETAKKVEKLNIATDKHTGLEILHMFIKDLLGRNTPAARIFETKSEEDFEHTRVVTLLTKRLAVFALVALNAFFVYYALLTGFRRGLSWQRMFLAACIIQFFVEIFLFETMECIWINCAIPALVSNEVRVVGDSIIEVVQQLCSSGSVDSELFLNAPDYLFVSTNVAKAFPELMESILVQAYYSHLPGELSKTWQVGSIARIQRRHNLRNMSVLATALLVLQYVGTAPFILHRMFIRFLQPFVFSGLVLLWKLLISDPVYIGIACAVVVLGVAYAVYFNYRSTRSSRASGLSNIAPELQDAAATATLATRRSPEGTVRKQAFISTGRNTNAGAPLHLPATSAAISSAESLSTAASVAPAIPAPAPYATMHDLDFFSGASVHSASQQGGSVKEDDDESVDVSLPVPPLVRLHRSAIRTPRLACASSGDEDAHEGSSLAPDSFSEISADADNERALRTKLLLALGKPNAAAKEGQYASSSDGHNSSISDMSSSVDSSSDV